MTARSAPARHTPGPWHVNAIKAGRVVGDETAAEFDKLQINGGNSTIATVYRRQDARPIAEVPALIDALEFARDWIGGMPTAPSAGDRLAAMKQISAAIAKATGAA